MSAQIAALGDPLLVAVAALGFGFWQLWSVRRDQRRHGDRKGRDRKPGDQGLRGIR